MPEEDELRLKVLTSFQQASIGSAKAKRFDIQWCFEVRNVSIAEFKYLVVIAYESVEEFASGGDLGIPVTPDHDVVDVKNPHDWVAS